MRKANSTGPKYEGRNMKVMVINMVMKVMGIDEVVKVMVINVVKVMVIDEVEVSIHVIFDE